MNHLLTATAVFFLSASLLHAGELSRIEKQDARPLMEGYFQKMEKAPEKHRFSFRPLGESTWLIDSSSKITRAATGRYIMDAQGRIDPLTVDSLSAAFRVEYPASLTEEERDLLIRDFVKLHAEKTAVIIGITSDIPGYDKAPLAFEKAEAVRAPFNSDPSTRVVCTYQQAAGLVRRYRFHFEDGVAFKRAECELIGRGIGAAKYYR